MLNIPEAIKTLYRKDNRYKDTPKTLKLCFYDGSINLLYPDDALWPSENLFLVDDTPALMIPKDQIAEESFVLMQTLCDNDSLTFGQCNASRLEVIVADVLMDLTGKEFTASVEVGGYELMLGIYKVDSFERQADRRMKKITAYDRMRNFHKDVAVWYQGLTFPLTLKQFRDSLCAHVGVEQIETALPLDNMQITKTIEPEQLSGLHVLKCICEINGCFGQIKVTGKLRYVTLGSTSLFPSDNLFPSEGLFPQEMEGEALSHYKPSETVYEDYLVYGIERVAIRQEEGDVGGLYGVEGGNAYTVQGNFLVYGKSTNELNNIAESIYPNIAGKIYRPCKIVASGLPWIEPGDGLICYTSDDVIETYCLKRTIKGIQAMTDTFEAEGNQEIEQDFGIQTQIMQLEGKTAVIKKSVEEVSVRVTDLKAYTEAQFKITADSILAEVKRAQEAEAALNIKANEITLSVKDLRHDMNAQFKVTADQITAEVKRAQGAENALSSKITQTATEIKTEITNTKNSLQSSITQNANQIALKVSKGDVSSQLSVENDKVTISGNRLIIDSTNFKLDGNGNATFSGNISGGTINIGNGNFTVDASGKAILKGAEFNGVINGATINGAVLVTGDAIVARNTLQGHNCYLDEITSNTIMCAHNLYAGEIYLQGSWWDGWSLTEEIKLLHDAVFGGG